MIAGMFDKVLVIEISTVCNLACGFCAHDKRLAVPRQTIPRDALEAFLHIVGQSASQRKETQLVSWLGGEPFLQRHLVPLTEMLHRTYPLQFSATTNGTQLSNADVRAHIRACYTEITISMDGLASFHDPMRGQLGLYDAVKSGIQSLAHEAPHLKLRINAVLMQDNFEMFPQLCVEFARIGVKEITFNQLGGRDRPEFYPGHRLTLEQVQRLPDIARDIEETIRPLGAQIVFSPSYFKRILATTCGEKLPILDCAPGRSYLFVNARGKVAPCTFTLDEYGKDLTSIQSITDWENLSSTFHREKMARQAPACLDCPNTNVHGKFS